MKADHVVWRGVLLVVVGWLGGSPAVYGQGNQAVSQAPAGYRDMPMVSSGGLRFFVDTAGFRGPKGYTREEVYILIDAKQLQFIPEKNYQVAQIDLTVTLADSSGRTVETETWTRNVSVRVLKDIQGAFVPFRDVARFDLPPGEYRMACTIEDLYGDKQGTCEGVLKVPDFEGESLVASDILFATKLEQTDSEGRFAKYGWNVVPNTTRRYFVGNPLRFYFEIYNLAIHSDRPGNAFVLGYSLRDSSGTPLRTYPTKRVIKSGKSIVKIDTLDTEGLEGGIYYFQVEAFDRSSREHIRKHRMVFMAAPQRPQEMTQEQKDQLRFYKDVRYIASKNELDTYSKLETHEDSLRFVRMFWKKLDPTPGTPFNERAAEHMQRMRYTENNFSGGHKKRGSDTDKGRVYIKYGPPDDIARNTGVGQKPYEVWYYERQGRWEFVFRDRRGVGTYVLVHSTYPGEIYNPSWQDEL